MDREATQKVIDLVEGPLEQAGFELAETVLSSFKATVTIKLFVYAEGGVNLDACARAARMVGELIEAAELFKKGFALEVSSPGLDRPLTTMRDFKYRVGETVRLHFVDPKRKKVTAVVVSVADDQIEFRNDDGDFRVPIAELEKARIIY